MPKPIATMTIPGASVWGRAIGATSETIAIYDEADLKRRRAEARKAKVKVTVKRLK